MKRAVPYVRVSTAEQAEGHSIEAQLDQLRDYARQHSYRIVEEYLDPGWQGDTENRPALRRLLSDARDRKFDVVLVYRFDRFFREVRLFLNAEHELREHDVRLISTTEAIDDTHEGRLQLLIKGSFAEYEKAVIRERANLGRNRAAREGKWMGGPPPYGYDLDPKTSRLVVNKEEARWVRKFFRWLVEDKLSLAQLQSRINDLGIPTKWENLGRDRHRPVNRKRWWMKRTVDRIVTRELYMGTYHYGKNWKPRSVKRKDAKLRPEEQWIVIPVPTIIESRLFRLAQLQLKRNAELAPRRLARDYMLRRLIKCGSCGRAWVSRTTQIGVPHYICSGRAKALTSTPCQRASISAKKIDPVVWTAIMGLLEDPQLVIEQARKRLDREGAIAGKERDLQQIQEQIRKAGHEDDRLVRAYKEGVIDLPTLKLERAETAQRIERLEEEGRRLASELSGWLSWETQLAAVLGTRQRLQEKLATLSYKSRCEAVQQIVEYIVVRDQELEIATILPAAQTADFAGQTRSGLSRKVTRKIGSKPYWWLGQDEDVIRITLFAKLPPPHPRSLGASFKTAA